MKRRQPRERLRPPDKSFLRSSRYLRALDLMAQAPDLRLLGFSEAETVAIYAGAAIRQYPEVSRIEFMKLVFDSYNLLRPVWAAPRSDTPTLDFLRAWSGEEASKLWVTWQHPSMRRQHAAAYEGTKACVLATAGLRRGPHFLHGWDAVFSGGPIASHFQALSAETRFTVRSYSAATRHLPKLAETFPQLASETCVNIVRSAAARSAGSHIGRYVVVDATHVPAWCQQRAARRRNGEKDPVLERHLSRRTPDAHFRAYIRTRDGLIDADTGRRADQPSGTRPRRVTRVRQLAKAWRGYLFIVLSDLATGCPLVARLYPASYHEPHALYELLLELFSLWPDIPLDTVVADKLWDEAEAHAIAEVSFGVHVCASRKASHAKSGGKILDPQKYRTRVAWFNGEGIAQCRHPKHQGPLLFEHTDRPSRAGLRPGEPHLNTDEWERHAAKFRTRWSCPAGCGKVSVATNLAWSALPYYPHNPVGSPTLFAMRLALLAHRNIAESIFSSLKTSFKQGLSDGCRTRVFDRQTYEMLLWSALVTRALLTHASHLGEEDGPSLSP
jgi:hypothetical protein